MISKKDFMKVWKDSSRESILNQYYYDYKTLREEYNKWNELKEWLENEDKKTRLRIGGEIMKVLSKMQEIESREE